MHHELKLLLVVFAWGVNYLILPVGVDAFSSGPFTLLRFAITAPILFALLWLRSDLKIAVKDIPAFMVLGLVGTTGYQTTFAFGVHMTTTTNAAVLFALSPVFSFLINVFTGRDRPAAVHWLGILVAFSGAVCIVAKDGAALIVSQSTIAGDATMLLAALLWAAYAHLSVDLLKKYGGLKVTAWSLISGVIGLALLYGGQSLGVYYAGIDWRAWAALAFSVFGATVIGVVLFYDAVPHLGSRRVMSYMYLVPAVAILAVTILHGKALSVREISGIGLVFLGVYLARLPSRFNNVEKPLTSNLSLEK